MISLSLKLEKELVCYIYGTAIFWFGICKIFTISNWNSSQVFMAPILKRPPLYLLLISENGGLLSERKLTDHNL